MNKDNDILDHAQDDSALNVLEEPSSRQRCCNWPRLFVVFLLIAGALGGLAYYAHNSTQVEPEFYQAALKIDTTIYEEAGDQFETQLLQLNTDVRNQKEWQASFSSDQVNGWLAFELPDNFPGSIPKEVSEPRVAFFDDEIKLAFRFVSPKWSGVISAAGTVFCTDQKNQIGIEIRELRSGVIPLPITQWSETISQSCAKSGINLTWSQKDGNTVAIVDLPERFLDIKDRKITLNNVLIETDILTMSGTSVPLDGEGDSNQAPGESATESPNQSPSSTGKSGSSKTGSNSKRQR